MPANSNGKVRIIGGLWKRTPIPVLNAKGLRPTGDRQRETLFNWLGFLLGSFDGLRALDMFGGSGALSFEFLSRGGAQSVLFETNRSAARSIQEVARKLNAAGLTVMLGNVLTHQAARDEGSYDVIFIDPPFADNLQIEAMRTAAPLLAPHGYIYAESPSEISDEALSKLSLEAVRRLKTGASHMLLAHKKESEE